VGVVDTGFDAGVWGGMSPSLDKTLKEFIHPDVWRSGDHGTVVSRAIAGAYVGDTFEQAMAHGSTLYVANLNAPIDLYPEFYRRGVKIINNSWIYASSYNEWKQSLASKNTSYLRHLAAAWQHRAVLEHNQLLVWAAGNDGEANAAWPAAAPSKYPDLQKGWLSVVWLNADNTLATQSNACGIAANWCLAAPSWHAHIGGTSLAAPVVTAAAALVAEAYPWMDNSLIRQTLLSTADPLGERAIYGWGRLNPDRAVRGPARFDSSLTIGDYFRVSFDNHRAEFFNDIGGDVDLVKDGSGTLVLWGQNTYAGHTYIDGGAIELYGSVAQDVLIQDRGALITNGGYIGGSLLNRNTASVSGAGLSIRHDLVVESGVLSIQLGSSISVGGDVFISGGRLEVTDAMTASTYPLRATVLQAANIYGNFDSVSSRGLLRRVEPIYLDGRLDVVVSNDPLTPVAAQYFEHDHAKLAAASAIDVSVTEIGRSAYVIPSSLPQSVLSAGYQEHFRLASIDPSFLAKVSALYDVQSEADFATALDSLTGEIHASSQALSFQQAQAINRSLSNRLDMLTQSEQQSGLWVSMLRADGKLRQSGYAEAGTQMVGAQFGADHYVGEKTVIGAALSWADGKAVFRNTGGSSQGKRIGMSVYARYGERTGGYLAARVGHDWLFSDVSRRIVIDQAERVESNRRDAMVSLYAESGRVIDVDEHRYTPFVAVEYNHLRRGAFAETGSSLGLRSGSDTYQQHAVSMGVRVQSMPIHWIGGDTTFNAGVAYRYSQADSLAFRASFVGAPNTSFVLKGIGLPEHSGWLGLGVMTKPRSTGASWHIHVDLHLDRQSVMSKAVSAGWRYEFG